MCLTFGFYFLEKPKTKIPTAVCALAPSAGHVCTYFLFDWKRLWLEETGSRTLRTPPGGAHLTNMADQNKPESGEKFYSEILRHVAVFFTSAFTFIPC